MSNKFTTLSIGLKLIFVLAGHATITSLWIGLGKEFAFESFPPVRLLYADEALEEIIEIFTISLNTLPLTLAFIGIVTNWNNLKGNKLITSFAVLWVSMFIGSWLHLGINTDALQLNGILSLKEYLLQGNFLIQLLTYPVAVFYQTYGALLFFSSLLIGMIAGQYMWENERKEIRDPGDH